MRIFPPELFIRKLKGTLSNPPNWLKGLSDEECLKELREFSGVDFGHDIALWEKWWNEEKKRKDIDPEF